VNEDIYPNICTLKTPGPGFDPMDDLRSIALRPESREDIDMVDPEPVIGALIGSLLQPEVSYPGLPMVYCVEVVMGGLLALRKEAAQSFTQPLPGFLDRDGPSPNPDTSLGYMPVKYSHMCGIFMWR